MSDDVRIELPVVGKSNHLSTDGPAIVVDRLDKKYDDNHVINDMSFSLERGKVYVIMGPSGCGKSTLLRHMIGVEDPDSGEVLIDGTCIHSSNPKLVQAARQKFGVLFQNAALLNGLTVAENVALPIQRHTELVP
ncbi:MAG: ATP-binding cassette domain-containing protein, partial [Planctomycetota bacterium]